MTDALVLDRVGKRYSKLDERAMLLRSILPFQRPARSDFWALRDVSCSVAQGECVGILGGNGAGKTTMLRLLAGVSRPSEGSVTINGRVAPLIGVGVGFHQEMTGRENVLVNGMLLGLERHEVEARFDEIIEFAELGEFIDTPVKFYSSGMFMRLGFSVAVHVRPEVLLVDEVLAVGDLAFQLKCFEHMRRLSGDGTTILIVSHSMHAIRLLCPRALVMRRGRLEFDGPSEAAIARHHELLGAGDDPGGDGGRRGGVTVVHRELVDAAGEPVWTARQHLPVTYRLRLRFEEAVDSPHLFFYVVTEDGSLAYEMKTAIGRPHRAYRPGDEAEAAIEFTPRLGGGTYQLLVAVTDRDGKVVHHRDVDGIRFYLTPPLGTAGVADLGASITLGDELLSAHDSLLIGEERAGAPPAGRA